MRENQVQFVCVTVSKKGFRDLFFNLGLHPIKLWWHHSGSVVSLSSTFPHTCIRLVAMSKHDSKWPVSDFMRIQNPRVFISKAITLLKSLCCAKFSIKLEKSIYGKPIMKAGDGDLLINNIRKALSASPLFSWLRPRSKTLDNDLLW